MISTDENPNSNDKINTVKMTVVAAIALILACSMVLFFYIIPQAKYDKAMSLYEEGKYDDAEAAFADMDYRDSQTRALEIQLMNYEKGDVFKFGNYDWIVLDKQEKELLVITKDAAFVMEYDFKDANVTWENSRMRPILNFDFYEENFDRTERTLIIERENPNNPNPTYGTWGGAPTSDRIFLLSIDEANMYFEDNDSRVCTYSDDGCWWWLRSSGNQQHYAANVSITGEVVAFGNNVGEIYGAVRPAMRLKIAE